MNHNTLEFREATIPIRRIDFLITKRLKLTQRQINALETKNTIYNTALKLFAKYGYDRVTVDEIAKYAGVSKGSFILISNPKIMLC